MSMVVVMNEPGGPEMLAPKDISVGEPGPGEVRIRQTAIGVNYVDVYFRSGLYPVPSLPAVLGLEGAGTVEAVGSGVESLRPGDRVAYAGMPLGAYAESRVLPAGRLVKLPDVVSERVAASMMLKGLTAHVLLHKVRAVGPGDWILVHAAAGGVGQIVTRWAKRLGAKVIGTVGSEGKVPVARAAGADDVVLHSQPGWADHVVRAAEGRGVHLAIDGIGGAMLAQTLTVVRPFGIVASIGQPAGPIPPITVEGLGANRFLVRPSVIAYVNDPEFYRRGTADLLAFLQDGRPAAVGAEYQLADAAKAHADLEAGRTTGSTLLIP
ncbi:quinone oxidoreductase [Telmatospirillum sp.]|uniref:quinone oxidoreductase family protein n=1 Tax=Telmatospirillum sp. TaxID=2079197 RepID=UPI002847A1E9|nr:quinone oxidoreductase [Telmatospirillum sp.]MDR3436847.1 quinone oxidoreductase [Telmatospirillum sp.]